MSFEEDRIELTGTPMERFSYDIINGYRNGVLYKEDESGRFVSLDRIPDYGEPYYEVVRAGKKVEIRMYRNRHEGDGNYDLIRRN